MRNRFWGIGSSIAGVMLMAGCNGIGDGSTLQTLQIVPANTATQTVPYEAGGTYKLFQCLRDELLLVGVFTDGTSANFNSRAIWTTSNPNVVQVSNRDIPITVVSSGAFTTIATLPYVEGTLVPAATAQVGDTATITAAFAGLTASINVIIGDSELKIVPAPYSETDPNPFNFPGPASLGPGTFQRFTVVGNFDGRIQQGADITAARTNSSSLALNPFLWKFSAGVYQPRDDDAATVFDDRSVVPDLTAPTASIDGAGTVRALVAGGGAYPIEAQLSLCSGSDPAPLDVQVLPFAITDPLTLDYEPGFHNPASFAPPVPFDAGDVVIGSNQILQVIGHLDSNADGVGDVTQYLGNQTRYNFEPKDAGCDANKLNCLSSSIFSIITGSDVLNAPTATTGRLEDGFDLVCLTDPLNAGNECDQSADETDVAADEDEDAIALEACFPLCEPRLASLEATLSAPLTYTFTATAVGPVNTTGAIYAFDFGDGTKSPANNTNPTLDHTYPGTGQVTATVRIVDASGAVTLNAGAVQINLDAPATNVLPTAALTASPSTGTAPIAVTLSAAASTAGETTDSVKIYEFQPDAGVVIRQNSSVLTWVYQSQPAAGFPQVLVRDSFGAVSASAATATVTITPATLPIVLLRSAPLPLRAIQATPCALEIVPPASIIEPAFSFPGLAYDAVASFIDTKSDDTQDCALDPLVGTQLVTRFVNWAARPSDTSEEFSEFVTLRNSRNDFQRAGQAVYLKSPAVDTTVSVTATATTGTLLEGVAAPAASALTITPCGANCLP